MFTLIELLVVIGVIAILAALLFPALGKSIAMVKRIECVNRLHQIGIAQAGYINDYDGYIPSRTNAAKPSEDVYPHTRRGGVITLQTDYLANKKNILNCPTMTKATPETDYYWTAVAPSPGRMLYMYIHRANPTLSIDKVYDIKGDRAIWACLTTPIGGLGFGHGKKEKNFNLPDGQSHCKIDGSAIFLDFNMMKSKCKDISGFYWYKGGLE